MVFPLLGFVLITFTIPVPATGDTCYPCHGQRGKKGYIDQKIFEQSVHGAMACTACHIGISGYPHGSVVRVNCGICHFLGTKGAPSSEARAFKLSVHGRALAAGNSAAPDCQTCHGSHAIYPSSDDRSSTNRWNIPALCADCHLEPFEKFKRSIHGTEFLQKKNASAPTCFDCHTEHRIPRTTEEQWKLALIKECGNCHAGQMNTYRKTYHGKITQLGYTTVAKCRDCHGSHAILPPEDPDSMLSKKNIITTCGTCHPGATANFTRFYAHPDERNRAKYPIVYYTYLFMNVLLIGVFAFFLTHTVLWSYRSLKERYEKKGPG